MKTLKSKVTMLSFGGSTTSLTERETIATPSGPIYAGTSEAAAYLALKAYYDPVSVLASALRSRQYGAAQACQEIAAILGTLPPSAGGLADTLRKLSAGLGAGPVSQADAPVDWLVRDLENHVSNMRNGMGGLAARAPQPPNPLATQPVEPQRLGSGSRWSN